MSRAQYDKRAAGLIWCSFSEKFSQQRAEKKNSSFYRPTLECRCPRMASSAAAEMPGMGACMPEKRRGLGVENGGGGSRQVHRSRPVLLIFITALLALLVLLSLSLPLLPSPVSLQTPLLLLFASLTLRLAARSASLPGFPVRGTRPSSR